MRPAPHNYRVLPPIITAICFNTIINSVVNVEQRVLCYVMSYVWCRFVGTPSGAFGVVCAGVHKVTEEVVAVKQIPRRLTKPSRLQAEVDLLRMAGQHRSVVNFRDLFSDDDEYYIVMGRLLFCAWLVAWLVAWSRVS